MRLGDYFSKKEKKSLFLPRGLVIGTVIRAHVNFTNPPKIKRFVIIGFNDDNVSIASVLINSDINAKIHYNMELISHQVPIKSENKDYLENDSYVDCSELHNLNKIELEDKIKKTPEIAIGYIEKDELDIIIKTIIDSDLIKGRHKKKCGIFNYKFESDEAAE